MIGNCASIDRLLWTKWKFHLLRRKDLIFIVSYCTPVLFFLLKFILKLVYMKIFLFYKSIRQQNGYFGQNGPKSPTLCLNWTFEKKKSIYKLFKPVLSILKNTNRKHNLIPFRYYYIIA